MEFLPELLCVSSPIPWNHVEPSTASTFRGVCPSTAPSGEIEMAKCDRDSVRHNLTVAFLQEESPLAYDVEQHVGTDAGLVVQQHILHRLFADAGDFGEAQAR